MVDVKQRMKDYFDTHSGREFTPEELALEISEELEGELMVNPQEVIHHGKELAEEGEIQAHRENAADVVVFGDDEYLFIDDREVLIRDILDEEDPELADRARDMQDLESIKQLIIESADRVEQGEIWRFAKREVGWGGP